MTISEIILGIFAVLLGLVGTVGFVGITYQMLKNGLGS